MFGAALAEITNRFLMDQGHSSEVKVIIELGNTKEELVDNARDYRVAYEKGIVKNTERNSKICGLVGEHLNQGRDRGLIICKERQHLIRLYLMMTKKYPQLKIKWVDHQHSKRFKYSDMFKRGDINILIASYILKRGKNYPLTQYVINASGGKGAETVLQILGRATRQHSSKPYTIMQDFWDLGRYLKDHSKKRWIVYKNEKLEVSSDIVLR